VAQALERTLQRAAAAIAAENFDQAEAALAEAETVQRDAPAVGEARRQLEAARAAAEAAAALRRLSDEEIRRARASFRRGRYQDAIDRLTAFSREQPAPAVVAEELDHLRHLQRVLTDRAGAVAGRVRELLAAAAEARNRGMLEQAHATAVAAQALDPANAQTAELLDDILKRQLDARIAQEQLRTRERRALAVAPMIEEARLALRHGYLDVALTAAKTAQRICPDAEGLSALLDGIRAELTADDDATFDLHELPPRSAETPGRAAGDIKPDAGMLGWLFRSGMRRRKA
jgi:NADH dehydrogenase/NADH:ubiquinone oxidoreductase subunit G